MNILCVFGTRPEAIKMAPVVHALQASDFSAHAPMCVKVCVTAQHRHMLDQVLDFFEIVPDFDLNLMQSAQSLTHVTTKVLHGMQDIYAQWKPDMVLVHGDTTTTFAASLSAYYARISVGHVEAGLRTHNKYSPWPEELNRKLTASLADVHFAPTQHAHNNLLQENISAQYIHITGNTVIDALFFALQKITHDADLQARLQATFPFVHTDKALVLVTGHRRENFGTGFANICKALKHLAMRDDVHIVYPVHLNPQVQGPVHDILGKSENCTLLEPLDYVSFVYLMQQSTLILTDSGGIQEEAPSLGKPVLVMRDTTERPEALASGLVQLVGTNTENIVAAVKVLLEARKKNSASKDVCNPYGDGKAAQRIAAIIKNLA